MSLKDWLNRTISPFDSEYKGRIKIIGVFSFMELGLIEEKRPDFIFTTVPLEHDLSIPTITISPFLDEKDRDLINKALNIHGIDDKAAGLRWEAEKFFKEELFYKNLAFQNEFQVIDFMANELYDRGYVPQNYPELVFEREKISPTSFGNLVAIPHPIVMNAYETVISAAVLDKPILWGNHKVQLVLMFAHIVEVIDDPKKVKSLTESRDFFDFKSRLIDMK